MGFWDTLRNIPAAVFSPRITYLAGPGEMYSTVAGAGLGEMGPPRLFATQPHLRTVVTFLARNVAHLGLHVYERVNDTDRVRSRDVPAAQALSRPNETMTGYDLIFALVGDLALYDRAFWHVSHDGTQWRLRRLPPPWVSAHYKNAFAIDYYLVAGAQGDPVKIPPHEVLAFTGYHPNSATAASPTVDALRVTLQEQVEAATYRGQVWKRGGRVSSVIQRPAGAKWSPEARESFKADWYSRFTGDGPGAGGTPVLEDGMTLNRIDFSAQEQQYVEAAKLSLTTVAAAFHVNPTMIGILDNANYSNVREFRRMLYGDTLGPIIAQIEARLNTFLLPALGMDPDRYYVEFNIAEKLQGSFEEQAQVMQTMVGAPIMTRNEARGRFNLPAVPEADGLVVPLNVLVGGQASPTDSGSQNRNELRPAVKAVQVKGRSEHDAKYREVLVDFFRRQRSAVLSRLGAKSAPDWWDGERWDRELSDDLVKLGLATSATAARAVYEQLGLDPDNYDQDRTINYLSTVAKNGAAAVNTKTLERLQAALADPDDDPLEAAGGVFDDAEGSRAEALALTLTTAASGFGTNEAGAQSGAATKTWETGPNPRPEHAAINGETVALSENFSNGLAWPGDVTGDADQTAGCNCSMTINMP